jgi:hypothetical protein
MDLRRALCVNAGQRNIIPNCHQTQSKQLLYILSVILAITIISALFGTNAGGQHADGLCGIAACRGSRLFLRQAAPALRAEKNIDQE